MRLHPLFALIVLAATMIPSFAEDAAEKALNDARSFARSGDYANALERHEWFHKNALGIRPSYYGVRLSFALGDWKRLGEKYPPALASLKAVRDEGLVALAAGKASREIFHDVSSINRELGEDDSTVSAFKLLHTKSPELAKKCFRVAQDTLIAKGEIELFMHYAGDLSNYMKAKVEQHRSITEHMKSRNDPRMALSLKHFDDELVVTALNLIEIATKHNDSASAELIREMTFSVVADTRLKSPR